MDNPITKNDYKRAWRARKYAMLPTKLCECGCGVPIPITDLDGHQRHFVKGHSSRGVQRTKPPWNKGQETMTERYARYRREARVRRQAIPKILCACCCGTLIPTLNALGKPARYALGHNGRTADTGGQFQRGMTPWNKGRPYPTKRQGNKTSVAKAGFRDDLQQFFRSRWEANYARYLTATGHTYTYEPACYIITLPDGRQAAYRPDFLIDNAEFVEIKGWTTRSADTMLKLEAAKTQLPHALHVICWPEYRLLEDEWAQRIPNWEYRNTILKPCEPRRCQECGADFSPHFQKQRYCSDACGGRAQRIRVPPDIVAAIYSALDASRSIRQIEKDIGTRRYVISRLARERT